MWTEEKQTNAQKMASIVGVSASDITSAGHALYNEDESERINSQDIAEAVAARFALNVLNAIIDDTAWWAFNASSPFRDIYEDAMTAVIRDIQNSQPLLPFDARA